MALFNTNAFRITEQGLSVLWQKQQIIAQNIANQDTPGYNCKYLASLSGSQEPDERRVHKAAFGNENVI